MGGYDDRFVNLKAFASDGRVTVALAVAHLSTLRIPSASERDFNGRQIARGQWAFPLIKCKLCGECD